MSRLSLPVSPHFTTVALRNAFSERRAELPDALRTPASFVERHGMQIIRGMPFATGEAGGPDVVLLDGTPVSIELNGATATYVLLVHAAEDAVMGSAQGSADGTLVASASEAAGTRLGGLVSEYELEYDDGSTVSVPILRHFAIKQARYVWGSMPFACVAAAEDMVLPSPAEALALGRRPEGPPEDVEFGQESRALPAAKFGIGGDRPDGGMVWIYALANTEPAKPLRRLTCRPKDERSAIYAVSLTDVVAHPLRPGVRRKLRVRLPDDVRPNAIGEFDDIAIDLGTVISARPVLSYDDERWAGPAPVVEPAPSEREVVYVEIARGHEIAPVRTSVAVSSETDELTFELEKVLRWREHGWVTADTHVHFLSLQTALLEGRAEGVNVVNLLASQWGEGFSNVGDYDGRTTLGADELGGRGEFLVRVGGSLQGCWPRQRIGFSYALNRLADELGDARGPALMRALHSGAEAVG